MRDKESLYNCTAVVGGHSFGYGDPLDKRPGRMTVLGTCEYCGYTVKFHTPKRRAYEAPAIVATASYAGTDVTALAKTLNGDPSEPLWGSWLKAWTWAMDILDNWLDGPVGGYVDLCDDPGCHGPGECVHCDNTPEG